MTSPDPTCTVDASPTPADVGAGASFTIALANPAGAQFWGLVAIGTDELNTIAAVNATLVIDQVHKTATCTAPAGLGSAVIFQSTVGVSPLSVQGAGRDINGVVQSTFTTNLKVNVLTSGGLRVYAQNETSEQDAAYGWVNVVNKDIRAGGGGGGGGGFTWTEQDVAAGDPALQVVAYGVVMMDPGGGGVTLLTPVSPVGGQPFKATDSTGTLDAGSNKAGITPTGGVHIEDPQHPGTFSTSTVYMVQPGSTVEWTWSSKQGHYKITGSY